MTLVSWSLHPSVRGVSPLSGMAPLGCQIQGSTVLPAPFHVCRVILPVSWATPQEREGGCVPSRTFWPHVTRLKTEYSLWNRVCVVHIIIVIILVEPWEGGKASCVLRCKSCCVGGGRVRGNHLTRSHMGTVLTGLLFLVVV